MHSAEVLSECITYMSNETKNLCFRKELIQVPTDSTLPEKFPFSVIPLFPLHFVMVKTLLGYSSPMLL